MRNLAGAALATIQDYPSIAAGTCAFAVAFALVAGNALFGQPGGHPDPIWATRDNVTTQSVAGAAAEIPVRKVRTETFVPTRIPVPSMRPSDSEKEVPVSELVRETQEVLRGLGVYEGEVDGLYGPKTRDAVAEFQRANGMPPDGQVSAGLLAAAAALSAAPALAERTPETEATGILPSDKSDPAPASARSEYVRAEPASHTPSARTIEDVAKAAMVARIQIGLMNFGEAGIAVDGVLGPHTVDAIRSFQRRYDLPVTGEPGEEIIRKLEQIGALQKSS